VPKITIWREERVGFDGSSAASITFFYSDKSERRLIAPLGIDVSAAFLRAGLPKMEGGPRLYQMDAVTDEAAEAAIAQLMKEGWTKLASSTPAPKPQPSCEHGKPETLGREERLEWWTRDPPADRKGRSVRHRGTRSRCPRCNNWVVREEEDAAAG
jgi:hypothetical protein